MSADFPPALSASKSSFTQKLLAEYLGSCLLVATVVGSGIMAERLAGGNIAVALLGNTIPTGAILVVLITLFSSISGAHFNPIVSAVFAFRGEITPQHAALYGVVQGVGGICGTLLAHAMFSHPLIALGVASRTGFGQWMGEITATFANPAVTIARAFTPTFVGITPSDVLAFVFAQIIGAVLAIFVSTKLFDQPKP